MDKETAINTKMIKPGKLYVDGDITYVVETCIDNRILTTSTISLPENYKLSFYDRITLNKGMIENYNGSPIETTLGVFLLNYVVLVRPFDAIIPYVNGEWNIKKIEDDIVKKVIDKLITPKQVLQYINHVYFLSSLNDICVPTLSEKCITSNDDVSARRDELFEQYKDQLDDPNIMVKIEEELIKLDREKMKGDICTGFLIKGKNYDVQRKRMFTMLGLMESFGDEKTSYTFSKTNLNEGWNMDELDLLANDIRKGSYSRAKSTALGGAESKMLGRNFQDSAIIEDDCGSMRGLPILLTKENSSRFVYRNILIADQLTRDDNGKNLSIKELTPENIHEYIDKTVIVRSPMYCNTVGGHCYTCMDTRFKKVGVKMLNIYPISISSTMVTTSLKAMHGTSVSLLELDDLNKLLV